MDSRNQWSNQPCEPSCTCVAACFFPCVVFAENVNQMEQNEIDPIPVVDCCMSLCKSPCSKQWCGGSLYGVGTVGMYLKSFGICDPCGCLFCIAQCFSIFIHTKARNSIRRKYSIQPDCFENCCDGECGDFLCAMCCYSCALAQENHMLKDNKPSAVFRAVLAGDPANIPITLDGMGN